MFLEPCNDVDIQPQRDLLLYRSVKYAPRLAIDQSIVSDGSVVSIESSGSSLRAAISFRCSSVSLLIAFFIGLSFAMGTATP